MTYSQVARKAIWLSRLIISFEDFVWSSRLIFSFGYLVWQFPLAVSKRHSRLPSGNILFNYSNSFSFRFIWMAFAAFSFFSSITFAYICVVFTLVCPNILLTV